MLIDTPSSTIATALKKNEQNPLQYSITYFEFDVKDVNRKEEDKFQSAASMVFSSGNGQQHISGGNPGSNNGGNSNTNNSTAGGSNRQGNNSYNDHHKNYSNNGNQFSSSPTGIQNDDEDVEMEEGNVAEYTQEDFDNFKEDLVKEFKSLESRMTQEKCQDKREYSDNLKKTLDTIRTQKQQMKVEAEAKKKEIDRKDS